MFRRCLALVGGFWYIAYRRAAGAAGAGLGGMFGIGKSKAIELLAEIDGFKTDASAPVIILAATNRPEVRQS